MFVGRNQEIRDLKQRLESDTFELIVIYGRRRVGKTRLSIESVKDIDHIYYLATTKDNLKSFKNEVSKKVPEIIHTADDWSSILRSLKDKVLIFDEFPYMIKEDRSLTSIFQKSIDTELKDTRTKIILLGSSITMMSDRVLGYSSPLYGRRTGTIDLGPLRFPEILEFYPGIEMEEICRSFAITDGVPYYMEKVEPPIRNWLGSEIRRTDSFLREEVDFLLRYEFQDHGNYKRILNAIALGKTRPSEIRDQCGMKHSDIMPYLKNLMDVRMVKREIPIDQNERSKRGRYYLSDNFLSFWFRFIHPNRSAIEEGIFDPSLIEDDFNRYMGIVFERISRESVIEMIKKKKINFQFNRVGKWWHRGEEIDIVCIDDINKKMMLFEVKWKELRDRDCRNILKELKRKGDLLNFRGYETQYGIVSRRSHCKEEHIFDLEDIKDLNR